MPLIDLKHTMTYTIWQQYLTAIHKPIWRLLNLVTLESDNKG